MSTSAHHTIRRQYLHVELNGAESDGLTLQRSLPDFCRHWLTPVIERTLDRFAPPEGCLYIERLEIDAGTVSLERLEHDLTSAVAEALEKSLREKVSFGESSSTIISGDIRHKSEQHSVNEAFIYFLKTGSLPWSFHLPAGDTLEEVILDSWRRQVTSGGRWTIKDTMLQVLAAVSVRMRLIRQFTPAFLEILLSSLSPAVAKIMGEILTALHSFPVPSADLKRFERNLWETVFAGLAAGDTLTAKSIVDEARRVLPVPAATSTALKSTLEHFWPGVTNKVPAAANQTEINRTEPPTNTEPTAPKITGAKRTPIPGRQHTGAEEGLSVPATTNYSQASLSEHQRPGIINKNSDVTDKAPTLNEQTEITKPESQNNPEPILPNPPAAVRAPVLVRQHKEESIRIEAGEGIYVENAGLIILHPFLPQLFTVLGIADEAKLLQPQRALCLLHFLVTGQTIAPEYELILPKILCNVPIETPVESDVALTDNEQEEAAALIEAVIRHWEVLRNTSPDGLRGTFLLRSGKVSLRDDGDWLLQVEEQSFDILLDQLPWGISMIRLPWMEKMLWVEWRQ
jgi:hypothetical protein